MMFQIETLHTFDTEYSADSIEWCSSLDFHDYFVCGTYQLVENQQEESSKDRKGRIYLFQYDLDEDTLQLKSSRDTNAILDQKWLKSSLITATSAGEVEHYKFEEDQLKIMANVRLSADEPEVLALSVDVNEGSKKILASDSKGNLSIIDLETMKVQENWAAHGFEAWTCAFDKWNENVVYSGGDDTFLNVYDLREDVATLKLKNKSHEAGVTSLLNLQQNILVTGSYDEKLRIFDTRQFKQPITEINLGGGIWRIKPSSKSPNILLVACMYLNFSIVDIKYEVENKDQFKLKLVGELNEHDSICYGCDWSTVVKQDYQYFATCSFYDHKLCLCRTKILNM